MPAKNTTSKTAQTAASRGAKTPKDHQEPQAFDELEGHELLRPFDQVKGSDQVRLLSRLKKMGLLDDAGDSAESVDLETLNLDELADTIDFVSERFANDPEAFDEWSCGTGGYARAMNLAVGYAGELGKSLSSED